MNLVKRPKMSTIIEEEIIQVPAELIAEACTSEEQQVIVHASIGAHPFIEQNIRLWSTIFLLPKNNAQKCKLIQSYNIVLYPQWQIIKTNHDHHFTLVFEGLPKDCTHFDLVEIIPESGAFESRNIARNNTDVYQIKF